MNSQTLQGKLLSPAGFGLVLLLFLLPFVAVSCGPSNDSMTATFTGANMITGSDPTISGPGLSSDDVATINVLVQDQYDVEPFALLAAAVVVLGMMAAFVRRRGARHLISLGLAALGLALLITAELRAIYRLQNAHGSDILGSNAVPDSGVATTRYGFWLAAAVLLALVAGHAVALVRARRSGDQPGLAADTGPPGNAAVHGPLPDRPEEPDGAADDAADGDPADDPELIWGRPDDTTP